MNASPPPLLQANQVRSTATGDLLVGGGFIRRLAAYLIDGFIVGVVALILVVVLQFVLGGLGAALAQVLAFILTVAYFSYLESSEWQATVGKRTLGMRVVDEYGYRLSVGQAILRYVSAAINWVLMGLGYLVIAFHPEKRGLHDLVAKTRVVLEDPNDTATPMLAWIIVGLYIAVMVVGILFALFVALMVGSAR